MDKKAMAKVREFDKKVCAEREWPSWFCETPFYFLEFSIIILIVCNQIERNMQMYLYCVYYAAIVMMELNKYLWNYEKNKRVSTYEILSYLPVTKKDIFLVRLEYLKNKMWKRFLVLVAVQILLVVEQKSFGVENILVPIVTTFMIGLAGILMTYPYKATRYS